MTINQTGIITEKAKTQVSANNEKTTMRDVVIDMQSEFAKALPKVLTPERFTRIALTALSNTPKLYECTKWSFMGALMNAAQLGLEVNTVLGQAYLIPYFNGKTKKLECQFQIGYKGLIDLAYRSGEVAMIQANIVYENDTYEYELGLNPVLKHIPALKNRGEMIGAYAVFHLKNGGKSFVSMSKEDIDNHAKKFSKTYANGPWQTNFEEMAKKTVVKQLLKYAPIRSDFITDVEVKDGQTAIFSDNGSLGYINEETGEVVELNEEISDNE